MAWLSVAWDWYSANSDKVNPIVAAIGGTILVWAAIRQARTATRLAEIAGRQAEIAGRRHEEQTRADQQRRITESFNKAVEQLASDKTGIRLGGIYTLERISRESPADYWAIMETLAAFVREQQPVDVEDTGHPKNLKRPLPTDIAAVLTVIIRRPESERNRERQGGWRFDLNGADLSGADLRGIHLEGANLERVHLGGANLLGAHLQYASIREAQLQYANLEKVHLERANLLGAHLEGANLQEAHFEHANLRHSNLAGADFAGARLGGADLRGTHLERANLERVHLGGTNLWQAIGDADTRLSDGMRRPDHWPAPKL
jgi:uncharacterized protein YjbI with pentapeptide repeats